MLPWQRLAPRAHHGPVEPRCGPTSNHVLDAVLQVGAPGGGSGGGSRWGLQVGAPGGCSTRCSRGSLPELLPAQRLHPWHTNGRSGLGRADSGRRIRRSLPVVHEHGRRGPIERYLCPHSKGPTSQAADSAVVCSRCKTIEIWRRASPGLRQVQIRAPSDGPACACCPRRSISRSDAGARSRRRR